MNKRIGLSFLGLVIVGLLVAACGGSTPETVEFNLDIRERELDQEETVFRVKNGDTIVLSITADEPGTLHVHGYDHEEELGTHGVTTIEFEADLEGRFALALHPGVGEGGHTHGEEEGGCETSLELAEGVGAPTIAVNAEPGPEAGEIEVGVELENFELALTETEGGATAGHWHLYVDGELRGMYMLPEAKVSGVGAGEHDIMVRLSDTEHCYFGVDAMTTVMVMEGASHGGMDMGEGDGGHGEATEPEETIIGFLEVLPR